MEHYIDHEWNSIAAKAKNLIPNDPDEDKLLNERFHDIGESPRGCSNTASGGFWRCKMYLGGKQRVLGYGTASQMARLYDAALWRFRQYRTDKAFAIIYNHTEQRAGEDNLDANIQVIVCGFEELLLNRKLIYPQDEREQLRALAKQDSRHKYTKSGRMEELLLVVSSGIDELTKQNQKIIDRLLALELQVSELAKQINETPPGGFRPINVWPAPNQISPTPMHITPGVPFGDPIVTCRDATNGTLVCKTDNTVQ